MACRVLGQHRSTQRKVPTTPDDEAALTADIVALAIQYGRYGYRRITAMRSTRTTRWGLAAEQRWRRRLPNGRPEISAAIARHSSKRMVGRSNDFRIDFDDGRGPSSDGVGPVRVQDLDLRGDFAVRVWRSKTIGQVRADLVITNAGDRAVAARAFIEALR